MALSKPRPILQDMPEHVKIAIVEDLSFRERVPLRLLSSEFKHLADSLKMREKLKIYVYQDYVWFGLNTAVYKYDISEAGCFRDNQFLPGVRFEDAALAHLDSYTSKPKLIIEKLTILVPNIIYWSDQHYPFVNKFQEKYATRPLKVEHLILSSSHCSEKEFFAFLPFMDSKILKSLDYKPSREVPIPRIIETDQWKNLEFLETSAHFLSKLPYESYAHISHFSIDFQNGWAPSWITKPLKGFLHSPTFKSAHLTQVWTAYLNNDMRLERQWQLVRHGSNNVIIDWEKQKCLCVEICDKYNAKVEGWTMERAKELLKEIEAKKREEERE